MTEANENEDAVVENETHDHNDGVAESWDRDRVSQSLIRRHSALAAGVGLVPVPGFDIVAVSGVSLNLIKRLSEAHGIGFSREAGMNVILALISGSLPFAARSTFTSLLKSVPVVGQLAGATATPALNAAFVYATGQVLLRHYNNGGSLLSFDAKQVKEYFNKQLKEGKGIATQA